MNLLCLTMYVYNKGLLPAQLASAFNEQTYAYIFSALLHSVISCMLRFSCEN